MEDMSGFDWQGKPGTCPIELQLDVLGLEGKVLDKLKKTKARVLDIGCGENFELVRFLRKMGINAEGLDPRIKENSEYLMGVGLPKMLKESKKIMPRSNNYYDMIVSHCMDHFYNRIYAPGDEPENSPESFKKKYGILIPKLTRSDFAVLEAVRVLKKKSDMVIFPGLTFIHNLQKTLEEEKCSLEQQPLPDAMIAVLEQKYRAIYKWFEEPIKRGETRYRTIIHKN